MDLSIVILNYKTKNMVKQCLKNIVDLNLPFEYEVIVIDNNSNDGTDKMMQEFFPNFRFIQSKQNKGMGSGNNIGIQNARGEYILILNPDVVVLKDSIESLLAVIKSNSKIGAVAPQLLNPNKTFQQSCYRFPKFTLPIFIRTGLKKIGNKKLKEYFMDDIDHSSIHQVDWARGSALLFQKDMLMVLMKNFLCIWKILIYVVGFGIWIMKFGMYHKLK